MRDLAIERPVWLRPYALAHLRLDTDDRSDPVLYLRGVRGADALAQALLDAVRAHQRLRGYREASVA